MPDTDDEDADEVPMRERNIEGSSDGGGVDANLVCLAYCTFLLGLTYLARDERILVGIEARRTARFPATPPQRRAASSDS